MSTLDGLEPELAWSIFKKKSPRFHVVQVKKKIFRIGWKIGLV
ncbi:MAG: hypothetical protein ABSA11_14860 [Candidatus Bathyarchaeia archaeon]|jgi:hypothetical protein